MQAEDLSLYFSFTENFLTGIFLFTGSVLYSLNAKTVGPVLLTVAGPRSLAPKRMQVSCGK